MTTNRNLTFIPIKDSLKYNYDVNGNMIEKKEYQSIKNGVANLSYTKFTYQFDSQNNLISTSYFYYDTVSQHELIISRYLLTYDSLQNLRSLSWQRWDTLNQNFITYNKDTTVYSATNKEISKTRFKKYYSNGLLKPEFRESYFYDSNDFIQYSYYEYYDTTLNVFKYQKLDTCITNSSGKVIEVTRKFWNPITSSFKNNTKDYYSYDNAGNIISSSYLIWNSVINSFVNKHRTFTTFDSSGNCTSSLIQLWKNNAFVNNRKSIRTYNSFNDITSEIEFSWDTISNSFINYSKIIRTYDSNNNVVMITQQYAQGLNHTLVNYSELVLNYDVNNNLETSFGSIWDASTNLYVIHSVVNYYYQSVIGIKHYEALNNRPFYLSPNPFNQETRINFEEEHKDVVVTIFDLKGNLVNSFMPTGITKSLAIPRGNLKSGIYFIEVETGNKRYSQKVLIEN
ncbi:MAG TPA: T9SS type A sorting domain-containing protein [Bacteroidia bacterium]|nr:T9SS type A sorting domain-containing protein [Bacteroidia bacterium]